MSQRRAFRPGHLTSFGHNVHVASTPGGVTQNPSRIPDTRKGPPPFINFEEHLNATNGNFTIPALNLSLNSPTPTPLGRLAHETPTPPAQNQSAIESILGRQPPSTFPSPTPTLVGKPDTPTGLSGVPNTPVSLTPRSTPTNTQFLQFPMDARPIKPLPSSTKSYQGKSMNTVSARRNPTAQSPSTDTPSPQHQPMVPPVPPSHSSKATSASSEPEFDPRPAKRLKTIQMQKEPKTIQDQEAQMVIHSGETSAPDWTSRIIHPRPLRGALQASNFHHLNDQIYYLSPPWRQDDLTLEEDCLPACPSSAEDEYLYPNNPMNNYSGIHDQDNLIREVESLGSLSFGAKLELYRHQKSEEYERASQRWAHCSLEDWFAGSDEILGEFMALFDRVTEHMAGNLEIFSRLGRTLDEHESQVLNKRESMLVEAKAALLTGGGHLAAVKLRSV